MSKPRLLDLFCGAGGAARGYQQAGFHVTGVDIRPQPRYAGDRFIQGDALSPPVRLEDFDVIHASPPCQYYASLAKGNGHWRSIPPTRDLLVESGRPYVIENIADAKWDMRSPVQLCGSSFGLGVRRHRLFETSFSFLVSPCTRQEEIRAYYGKKGWLIWTPAAANVQRRGRRPLLRGTVEQAAQDMGIDWMTWDELRESIPPAYCKFIGEQLLEHLKVSA